MEKKIVVEKAFIGVETTSYTIPKDAGENFSKNIIRDIIINHNTKKLNQCITQETTTNVTNYDLVGFNNNPLLRVDVEGMQIPIIADFQKEKIGSIIEHLSVYIFPVNYQFNSEMVAEFDKATCEKYLKNNVNVKKISLRDFIFNVNEGYGDILTDIFIQIA